MTGHLRSERRMEPAVRFASGGFSEWHTAGVVAVRGDGRDDVPRWALLRKDAHAGSHHVYAHPRDDSEPVVYEMEETEVPPGWLEVQLVSPSSATGPSATESPRGGGLAAVLGAVAVVLPVVGWLLGVLLESIWRP